MNASVHFYERTRYSVSPLPLAILKVDDVGEVFVTHLDGHGNERTGRLNDSDVELIAELLSGELNEIDAGEYKRRRAKLVMEDRP